MGYITVLENGIEFERRNELARIIPWGENTLRFLSSPNGYLADEDWTLLKQPEVKAVIRREENYAEITNGTIRARMYDNGKVCYYKKNIKTGEFETLLEEMTEFAFDSFYRTYRANGSDTHRANVLFKPDKAEHFYGLGGEHDGCFDKKGSTSELQHRNTKSSIPFVYSSKNYGFLWNNPSVGQCELTNNHTKWVAYRTKQVDYLVIAGDSPAEIMGRYADLTGHTPDFPEFAAGFWQSKLRYESQEDLLWVAREYKRRNIPVSVMVIDYFHWTEQGDFKFNPELWPDPAAMVKELKEMGIELMVSIWPTSNPLSENYVYMDDHNMILRTENGLYGMQDFYGQQDYIDTLNPKARDYMWRLVKKNYYDSGIKYFWLDEAEPGMVPNHYDNIRCCRGNFEEYALLYPYYYEKMFYEGLAGAGEKDIITLDRAGYTGSQRYGALLWSGDVPSTFEALGKSVRTGLAMAMSGILWWTTDIGGFWGGDIESDEFRELIVRWFQFGVFCPVTRLHGKREKPQNHVDRHPGIFEMSGGDNELWSFGEDNYRRLKQLAALRERLRPYVMQYMAEAKETGISIMRPLFMEYPQDEVCYRIEDAYLFGRDILFAPITEKGQTKRRVYVPQGRWVNVNNHAIIDGGQWIEAEADLNHFIAFVREGAEVMEAFAG